MPLVPNPQPTERFWVVWCPDRCSPTKKHPTEAEAIKEAERLAQGNTGYKFYVLETVGFAQRVIPSTFTYVSD